VGQPEGKRPIRKRRCRWVENMTYFVEVGGGGVDFIGLAQDRYTWIALVNAALNFWVP
jgi:hypothetical protein